MTTYEELEQTAYENHIEVLTYKLPIDGFYYSTRDFATVTINDGVDGLDRRGCVLARGIGYHTVAPPNLLDVPQKIRHIYDRAALRWAVQRLMPWERIIDAWEAGVRSEYEMAEYLEITPEFLRESVDYLRSAHGDHVRHKNICIGLSPIIVREVCAGCYKPSRCPFAAQH